MHYHLVDETIIITFLNFYLKKYKNNPTLLLPEPSSLPPKTILVSDISPRI